MPLTQSEQNIFSQRSHSPTVPQPLRGVRQDKRALTIARSASAQPAPDKKDTRAINSTPETNPPRSQKSLKSRRRSAKVTCWLSPLVKAELQRMAEQEGLSVSAVGAALLEDAIEQDIHRQHEALLQPLLREIMREELRAFGDRLVFFLMRIAFASEQSRILITNVLDKILSREKAPEGTLNRYVDQSNKLARRNIIQKTPQLKTLLEAWEQSFDDIGREAA